MMINFEETRLIESPLTFYMLIILQLDEINSGNQLRQTWEGGHDHQRMLYETQHARTQLGLMFQPLDCNPTLQIG